ncbi:peptidoglycan recognition protein family protein [Streptomyces apocyni]|uniref:peptidoglycan recognition protein family protein n=1 Tax=Streptomyces apocyni TaxID=2654677 RepID=UPI0012E9E09B|nr:N-acetylmuramoyl-L-alanine amidase [Streptomyces apocyni]
MAWYPGAIKMELQPESDAQPAIRPTQFIVHSIVAPWTARRTYEYWRDSTNLESHFGVDYQGDVGQYIGTETRADANAGANRRHDGTGAVSAETASNLEASDPWNAKQIENLIAIGVWLHERHGIPLRICRGHGDPGFGYHSMFPQWSTSGTACPGRARIRQFREVVFPGIVARANGHTTPQEDDMALTREDIEKVAQRVWEKDHFINVPWGTETNGQWMAKSILVDNGARLRALQAAVTELAARGAARDAVLARLAEGGGLSAADAQRAAEAGATAALDRLAIALAAEGEG